MQSRPTAFGQVLRELRVAAALTQEALAERAGMSYRGISDLERGTRRNPYSGTVRRLADALELAADERADLEAAAAGSRGPSVAERSAGREDAWVELASLTSFVGRAREQAHLHTLIAAHSLVSLIGVAGIGKTRLALAVASAALPHLSDRVIVVSLASLTDPSLVRRELAIALNLHQEADQLLDDALVAALEVGRPLVVLDNCEHLLVACARLAALLTRACPVLRILATSREPLGAAAETVFAVPPLIVGDSHQLTPSQIGELSAVQLFRDRARQVWPRFQLTQLNAACVARVCRRLDGIPLAIELAAARTRVLSVQQIDDRLRDRYRLLVGGDPDSPARHQTLLSAVDWSYALLTAEEQELFDRLCVFRGGARLEAVEAVCATPEVAPERVADVLQSLVEKSLVVAEPTRDGAVRFRQLETLRLYAETHVVQRAQLETLNDTHLAYHVAVAERLEPVQHGPDASALFDALEVEHDNLRAALSCSTAWPERAERGLRLAAALARFWILRGHVVEGRLWFARLAPAMSTVSDPVRGRALNGSGFLAFQNADYEQALSLHRAALAIWRRMGNSAAVAASLSDIAIATSELGDTDGARRLLEESLQTARDNNDHRGTMAALMNLAITARRQQLPLEARGFLEQGIELVRATGDRRTEATALHNLGNLDLDQRDATSAALHFRAALALAREFSDWACVTRCLSGLAEVIAVYGHQPARAAQLLGAADALRGDIGIPVRRGAQPRHERAIANVATMLEPTVFAALWARGKALSRERMVKLALAD